MATSSCRIHNIKEKPKQIEQVIALGDSQKKTLGFLPEGAYYDYARRGWILIAVNQKDEIVGYLAFRQTRELECHLVHVCVAQKYRGDGIARKLIDRLKNETKHLRRIILKCRRDYKLDPFWKANGFIPKSEKRGRANYDTRLTIWEYGLHPSLLSLPPSDEKLLVILDMNIIIGAHYENDSESEALFSKISSDEVDYRISEYSFSEANKCDDLELRAKTRAILNSYSKVAMCPDNSILAEVMQIIGQSDESDAQQIASAIFSEAECFITKDRFIINKAEEFYRKFAIHIYTPTEFLINISDDIGKKLYAPNFAVYSDIAFSSFEKLEEIALYNNYRQSGERIKDFRLRLTLVTKSNGKSSACRIIANNEEIGVCVQSIENNALLLHLIRLRQNLKHKLTIGIHIIEIIMQNTINLNAEVIICKDSQCGRGVELALSGAGFYKTNDGFLKVVAKGFLSTSVAIEKLQAYTKEEIHTVNLPINMLLDIENRVWPAKILSLAIPIYLIPIQPRWAQRLLSPQRFQGLLFDHPSVMIQSQRVYYRSARGISIESPARLIWYVSGGRRAVFGKCVIGVSLVDSVEIMKINKLFPKYERLGVYTWGNIFRSANANPDKEMMAILFSKTEIFHSSITYSRLVSIVKDSESRNILTISPFKINQSTFQTIYELGTSDA